MTGKIIMPILKRKTKKTKLTYFRFKDRIFFDKEDVKYGSVLAKSGRRDPITFYDVVEIDSYFRKKKEGQVNFKSTDKRKILRKVPEVRHMSDKICMRNKVTGEMHTMSFSYIVASAIWRLN